MHSFLANADIALFHKAGYDPAAKKDIWESTAYLGCHWHARVAAPLSDKGRTDAGGCTVRIFTASEVAAVPGDVVVRGLTSLETPREAQDAGLLCFTVQAVTDDRRGTPRMQHWKLEGA